MRLKDFMKARILMRRSLIVSLKPLKFAIRAIRRHIPSRLIPVELLLLLSSYSGLNWYVLMSVMLELFSVGMARLLIFQSIIKP